MKKVFGRFGKIFSLTLNNPCGIYSPDGSSTRLGEADCRRVCLPAQKSYKSGQIEQINVDKKRFGRFGKIWKDLEDFSAKPTEKECVSRHRNPTNQDKSNK